MYRDLILLISWERRCPSCVTSFVPPSTWWSTLGLGSALQRVCKFCNNLLFSVSLIKNLCVGLFYRITDTFNWSDWSYPHNLEVFRTSHACYLIIGSIILCMYVFTWEQPLHSVHLLWRSNNCIICTVCGSQEELKCTISSKHLAHTRHCNKMQQVFQTSVGQRECGLWRSKVQRSRQTSHLRMQYQPWPTWL